MLMRAHSYYVVDISIHCAAFAAGQWAFGSYAGIVQGMLGAPLGFSLRPSIDPRWVHCLYYRYVHKALANSP